MEEPREDDHLVEPMFAALDEGGTNEEAEEEGVGLAITIVLASSALLRISDWDLSYRRADCDPYPRLRNDSGIKGCCKIRLNALCDVCLDRLSSLLAAALLL